MAQRKKYYALADTFGFPIPGTMYGSDDSVCACSHIALPECKDLKEYPEYTDLNTLERFHHPSGLRFFYKVKCTNGPILPNSLISTLKHPGPGYVEIISVKCCD